MFSKQIIICLVLCCLALITVYAAPMNEFEMAPSSRQIYEMDEDSLEDQSGRAKREEGENVINGETNVRKPLIFKRETNVRKPLLFKRYTDEEELRKLWFPRNSIRY